MTYRSTRGKFNDVGATILSIAGGKQNSRSNSIDGGISSREAIKMHGNHSKNSVSWINGPTHEIQDQCVPGYTGFIPGVKAENVFSTTYANNCNKSFREVIPRGHDPKGSQRYNTVSNEKFSPRSFRRIIENKDMASRRDYLEYTMSLNQAAATERDRFLRSPQRNGLPTKVGNSRTAVEDPSGATISPIKHKRDLNGSPLQALCNDVQVKPRLIERKIAQSQHYATLGDGFKRAMAQEDAKD